jgi:hypothetical protein
MSLPILTLVRLDKRVGGLYGDIDLWVLEKDWIRVGYLEEGEVEIVSHRYGA